MNSLIRILLTLFVSVVLLVLLLVWVGVPGLRAAFLAINSVTLAAFGYDKRQAQGGGWRVPEAVLHIMALAGGTPAAVLGMILFHHKTQSPRFMAVLFCIACVQLLLIVGLARIVGG